MPRDVAGGRSIPGDPFFGDRAPPRAFHVEDEETGAGFGYEPPAPPPPATVAPEAFYAAEPPPPERTLASWAERPLRHGLVLAAIGFVGTLVLSANLLTQIVIGAPVFEELWKFGVALLLVVALRVEAGPLRVALALVPGAAFGAFEHALTYPDEPLVLFANRLLFHSGATALSMATYVALLPVWDARVRWAATVPATILHWTNNFAAVVLGLGGLVLEAANVAALSLSFGVATLTHVAAWSVLAAKRRVRGLVLHVWARHAPEDLKKA